MENDNSKKSLQFGNFSIAAPLATLLIFGYVVKQVGSVNKTAMVTVAFIFICMLIASFVAGIVSIVKQTNKKDVVRGVLGIVLSLTLLLFLGSIVITGASRGKSKSAKIAYFVKQSVNYFPKMLDADTRCDSLTAADDEKLIQHFTLVNYTIEEMDTAAFREVLDPQIKSGYKTQAAYEWPRKNGVPMEMIYRDKNGEFICRISTN